MPKKACANADDYQNKLQLAARLVAELPAACTLIAVADGAFAKRAFVQVIQANGRFVLSRLRRDAVFYDLPAARVPGQKGASHKYGDKHKVALWATQPDD